MEPRDHQRLVAVWQPGSGIGVHNVKCGVFHLFVCFTAPCWSILLRNTQGRLVAVFFSQCPTVLKQQHKLDEIIRRLRFMLQFHGDIEGYLL